MNAKRKIISLLLVLVLAVGALASCAPAKTKVVGTVGEYKVSYDEFYFLAFSYKRGLEAKYGEYGALDAENAKKFDDELRELVYSNIVTNYAILSLCAEEGLTLKSEGLDGRVDEYLEKIIISDFNSDKGLYKDSLKQYGMTEHYLKLSTSVDMLYSDLLTVYLERFDGANDNAKLKDIIKKEFVRTWHIAVLNDAGESIEANRDKAEMALSKYRDGSMSMYKLIGSQYNEDLSITDLDGVYFTRGSMDEAYEKAAFALEIGEVSDVVATADAFYVIQRLALEDAYINKNLEELKEAYMGSVIYDLVEEKKGELAFEPNDFAKELDLSGLEAPAGDGLVIGLIIGGAVLLIAGAVVVVIIVKKRRDKALIEKKRRLNGKN